MNTTSSQNYRTEVITSAQRRRRWAPAEKNPASRAATLPKDRRDRDPQRSRKACPRKKLISRKRPVLRTNHKRVYWVIKENNLLLQKFGLKAVRIHDGKVETLKSNVHWCSDAFRIQCWNAELIRDLMTETIDLRFNGKIPYKVQWLSQNGPCNKAREYLKTNRTC